MGRGGEAIKPPNRETDRKPGGTNANLLKAEPGEESCLSAGGGRGDRRDGGLAENQLADLHGTSC